MDARIWAWVLTLAQPIIPGLAWIFLIHGFNLQMWNLQMQRACCTPALKGSGMTGSPMSLSNMFGIFSILVWWYTSRVRTSLKHPRAQLQVCFCFFLIRNEPEMWTFPTLYRNDLSLYMLTIPGKLEEGSDLTGAHYLISIVKGERVLHLCDFKGSYFTSPT